MAQTIARIGHCLGCNYDLRGLAAHACPECGRAFDPDNPSTVRNSDVSSPGAVARCATAAPGWLEGIAVAAVCVDLLWAARLPGSAAHWVEASIAVAFCIGRLLAFVQLRMLFGYPRASRGEWRRLAVAPIAVVCAFAAAYAFFAVAMQMSYPALEKMAQQAIDTRYSGRVVSGWAGIYYIEGVYIDGNPSDPGTGTAQLVCSKAKAIFVIEDVHAGNSPAKHGKSYWRHNLWISSTVE